MYSHAGYVITTVLMDQDFECVRSLVPIVEVNTTAARKHVAEIERSHRTTKERMRSIRSTLPYKYLLKQVTIGLTYFVTFWINAFVDTQGISKIFSPREIITRRGLDWNKHARAVFGQYIQAHEDCDLINTMAPRTFPALYLGPTGNIQGTVKAFDLDTGQIHKVREFTRLPMPESVIRKAEL